MELVKLNRRGRVALPRALLHDLGIKCGAWLIAEAVDDGAIVLRPAEGGPIELYSDERIAEFDAEGAISDTEWERVVQLRERP